MKTLCLDQQYIAYETAGQPAHRHQLGAMSAAKFRVALGGVRMQSGWNRLCGRQRASAPSRDQIDRPTGPQSSTPPHPRSSRHR